MAVDKDNHGRNGNNGSSNVAIVAIVVLVLIIVVGLFFYFGGFGKRKAFVDRNDTIIENPLNQPGDVLPERK